MAKILAAELGADAELLCHPVDVGFHLEIAERVAVGRPRGRKRVEVARRGELDRLERLFGARPADDDRQVVGRAGGGPERQDLLLEEGHQPVAGQERRRPLVEECLVGGAATLGDEEEFVGVLALRIDLDLRRQVGTRVALLEHRDRRELGIAQVALEVGIADALCDGALVISFGPDRAALLAHDDRRARVLAHGQDAAGGDIGVLQQVGGDELVVRCRLRIVEDGAQLPQMSGPQEVVDVEKGLLGKKPQRLPLDDHDLAPAEAFDPDALVREFLIGRVVGAERKEFAIGESRNGGHRGLQETGGGWRDEESTPSSASVAAGEDAEGSSRARRRRLGQDGV